ncbi:permease-like cell division protein FtsX [Rugosimonospora africana]|uniref:FtsX extracellular domain-containing protein n=1 Tax=Rugosimonospora africana TaxID=556532 RepID=A0A8J3R180_9ACTN|nr:permease-like cell division protein FtsX [Rugosimonospora africana]GIH20326.1 hypothetical protein Raf01_84980 [Rugosimonospora africana]
MRRAFPIVALVLLASLAGCSQSTEHQKARLSIFLRDDVTDDQRSALNNALRATPDVQGVSFESKEEAYEKFKQQFKDAPDLVAQTDADSLPGSYQATITDGSLAEAIESTFVGKPGVLDMSVDLTLTKVPATEGVVVRVSPDITADQRTALERAIRALRQAKPARFESADAAYARLKEACKGQPALAKALRRDALGPSYRFSFTFTKSAAGDPPGITLGRLAGVDDVFTVPVSAL